MAPKNGYCLVYISNESSQNVFFDNLQVRHDRERIIEENHYYPYGLKIAAISSKAYGGPDNDYLYQGDFNEFDDDLGWNDFALRSYDPQIGRFLQSDPSDQFASGYVGMGNDPVKNIDPTGGFIPGGIVSNAPGMAAYFVGYGGMVGNMASSTLSISSNTLALVGIVMKSISLTAQGISIGQGIGQHQRNVRQAGDVLNNGASENGILLVFDGEKNKIAIYSDDGTEDDFGDDDLLGVYDAHNNVSSKSRGKWEDGIYDMEDKLKRHGHGKAKEKNGILKDSPNGGYGTGGIYRAKPFKETKGKKQQRSGMAVHAGRQHKPFLKRVTMVCIRTTEEGMLAIDDAIKTYGKLNRIIVRNNKASSNSKFVSGIRFGSNNRSTLEKIYDCFKSLLN